VDEVRTYRVVIGRDSAGLWVASVPAVPGAHTQGRTIEQARRRIREALSLWVRDADRAHLEFEVRLPAALRGRVERALELRESAETTAQQAAGATERALVSLVEAGLSRRDAGEVLGISRQRAQQIAETHESSGSGRGGGRRVAAKRAVARRAS
jgi:predicted RNase H-like HicB family nuclease